jgi:CelD/BcsL family acetyltransferase involved in cellulose biosynthesis
MSAFSDTEARPRTGSAELRAEIVEGEAAIAAVLPELRDLARTRSAACQFFQDPDVFLADARYFGRGRTPFVVLVRKGGSLVCAGMCRADRGTFPLRFSVVRLVRVPVRRVSVLGSDFIYARGEDPLPLARAALRALEEKTFDLGILGEMREPSPVMQALETPQGSLSLELASREKQIVHRLNLPPTLEKYLAALGTKKRNNRKRSLKRWTGDPDVALEEFRTAEDVPRFLQALDQLFPHTWQAKTFGARSRSSPEERGFLETVARLGWFRSYLLTIKGAPVGFVLGYQHLGVYYHEETGYDLAHAERKPGIALNLLLIDRLFEKDPPQTIDFGFGDNEYKQAVSNQEIPAVSAYLARTPAARALVKAQRGLDLGYRHAKNFVEERGLARFARDLLKRRGKGAPAPAAAPKAGDEAGED